MHSVSLVWLFAVVITSTATSTVKWRHCYHKYDDWKEDIEGDITYSYPTLPQLCSYELHVSNASKIFVNVANLDTANLKYGLIVFNGPSCHAEQWTYMKDEGSIIGKNPMSFITSEMNSHVEERLFQFYYTKETYKANFSRIYQIKECGGTLNIESNESATFPTKFVKGQPCIWKIESKSGKPWFKINQISATANTNQIWVLDGPECHSPILNLYTESSTAESFTQITASKNTLTILSLANGDGDRFTAYYGTGNSKPSTDQPVPTPSAEPHTTPVQPDPTPSAEPHTTPVQPDPTPSAEPHPTPAVTWKNCNHKYVDWTEDIEGDISYSSPTLPQLCSYELRVSNASRIFVNVPRLDTGDLQFGLIVFNGLSCHAPQWTYIKEEGGIIGKNPLSFITSEINAHVEEQLFQFYYTNGTYEPTFSHIFEMKECGGILNIESNESATFPIKFAKNQPCIWKIESKIGKPWFQMNQISVTGTPNLVWVMDGPECSSPILQLYTEKSTAESFTRITAAKNTLTIVSLYKGDGARFSASYGTGNSKPPAVKPLPLPDLPVSPPPSTQVSWKTCQHKYVDDEGIISGDASYSHPSHFQLCSYELSLTSGSNINLHVPMLVSGLKFGLIVFNGQTCHSDQWAYINTEGAAISGENPISFVTSERNAILTDPFFQFEYSKELATFPSSNMFKTRQCGGTLRVRSTKPITFPSAFAHNEPCIWKIQTRLGNPWFKLDAIFITDKKNLIWVLDGPDCSSPVLKLYTEKSENERFKQVVGSGKTLTVMSLCKGEGTRFTATYGGV